MSTKPEVRVGQLWLEETDYTTGKTLLLVVRLEQSNTRTFFFSTVIFHDGSSMPSESLLRTKRDQRFPNLKTRYTLIAEAP